MLRQLFQKEIRLQKSNLYFVFAMILVWGILLALATRAEPRFGHDPEMTIGWLVSVFQVGFVGFCLLVAAPLLVGAAMVAEERKLGVWEWQLSLPCPRRTQWAVKLAVGSAITLALTLVVQPLLDFLSNRAMANHASGMSLPSVLLGENEIYRTVPLLLMMSAAFVSSMSRDPYKAFFLGIVFFGFVVACFTAFDPAHQLIQPWNQGERFGMDGSTISVRLLVNKQAPWVLGLGLSAGLGALSQFNFRLEGFRWRRFLCHLASVFLLAAATTWIGLQLEFGIGGLVSQEARDVEPLILRNLSQMSGGAEKTVDWAGIDPVLVQRFKAADEKESLAKVDPIPWHWRPGFLSRVIRSPGTGRVLAQMRSFPVFKHREDFWPQVVELGIDKPHFRPILSLFGHVAQVFPEDSVYVIGPPWYYVTRWPVPVKVGGLLSRIFMSGKPFEDPESNRRIRPRQFNVEGTLITARSSFPLNMGKGYWGIVVHNTTGPSGGRQDSPFREQSNTWLIKKGTNNNWSLVDKQPGTVRHGVSSDGKWYARRLQTFDPTTTTLSSIGIYSCDHTASWTIAGSGGHVILCKEGYQDYVERPDMGKAHLPGGLDVSHSGRFLPFMEIRVATKPEVGREKQVGGCPEVAFALLDLQTGQERVLLHTKPDRFLQPEITRYADQPRIMYSLLFSVFPPLLWAWAPDRDALAILFDERIYLFERRAQNVENAGDFHLLGAVDLTGFEILDMDFWNSGVMLAWGGTGLYRIDLAKALKPAPPEQ